MDYKMSSEEIEKKENAKPKLVDNRKKFFFWAYNDLFGRGLSPNAISIYCLFCSMSGNSRKAIWPSYEYISQETTIKDKKTIRNALNQLERVNLIKVHARYDEKGGRISNMYELLDKKR